MIIMLSVNCFCNISSYKTPHTPPLNSNSNMLLGLQDTKFEGVGTKTPHNSPRNSVSATSKFTMVGTKTPHNSPRNSVSVTSKFTRVGTKTPHNSPH
jgi:uncharacterized Ntn-hydrolase superfamily protein